MRAVIVAALSFTLAASTALAADGMGVFAPGHPAGVKQAQAADHTTLYVLIGVGAIVTAAALAASTGDGHTVGPASQAIATTGTTG